MNGPDDRPKAAAADNECGACRIGEHEFCEGNHDLPVGPGPAIPLIRCGCRICQLIRQARD